MNSAEDTPEAAPSGNPVGGGRALKKENGKKEEATERRFLGLLSLYLNSAGIVSYRAKHLFNDV